MNYNGTARNTPIVKEPTLLYLVRHCQSTGQEPDAPLTPLGVTQAERLADTLQPHGIARIVSSSYRRAQQSIAPLATRLGLPLETDARLIERVLSTERLDDWRAHLLASWADPDRALPGGESGRQATARALAAISEALADARQPVVVVSHGNLISLLLHAFDGRPGFTAWEALTNPDLFVVHHTPDAGWSAVRTWAP